MSKFQLDLKWLKDEFQGKNNTGCVMHSLTEPLTRVLLSTLVSSRYNCSLEGRAGFHVIRDCLHSRPLGNKEKEVVGGLCVF